MLEGGTQEAREAALVRQLRLLIGTAADDAGTPPDWRDDLRLFAFTWAAGFLFFMILFA